VRIFQILTIFAKILAVEGALTLANPGEFAYQEGFPEGFGLLTRDAATILMLGTVEDFVRL
jgi:hypothetical protein